MFITSWTRRLHKIIRKESAKMVCLLVIYSHIVFSFKTLIMINVKEYPLNVNNIVNHFQHAKSHKIKCNPEYQNVTEFLIFPRQKLEQISNTCKTLLPSKLF